MTTRLSLVCHASTSAVRAADFPGDEPLDARGLEKTSGLGRRLEHADRTWTSPALRARQTAEQMRLSPTVDPALRDWDYGQWAGRSLADVQAQEPEALARWLGDPAFAPPHGESLLDVIGRSEAWLDAQTKSAGKVVAITHAAVVRAVIVVAVASGPGSFWHFDIGPLSITRLSYACGRWTLVEMGPLSA